MRIISLLLSITFLLSLSGCKSQVEYKREYLLYLETYSTLTAYAANQTEFNIYANAMEDKLKYFDTLFNIYDNGDIPNLKTINDNAGISPVQVDPLIIDLLTKAKEDYSSTNGAINIAMGSVLTLWHNCRIDGIDHPETAAIPDIAKLQEANTHTDIDSIIIDDINNTVFITDPYTSIDVGAVAKGYVADAIAAELKSLGMNSGLINLGGNVVAIGSPPNKTAWSIGIQNPDNNDIMDKVNINNLSAVTSGNYQRYYIVDGKRYHHIIDPNTLMPADMYKSVTVIHSNSTVADMLSTALFILPYADGVALAEQYNAQAMWINNDNSISVTDEYNNTQ